MEKTRFLIFGHKGWIGNMIVDYLGVLEDPQVEIIKANSKIGTTPIIQVEEEINASHPTHIICSIGRTHGPGSSTIDYLEPNNYKEAPEKVFLNVRDNLFAPVMLALLCEKLKIHLTYIGTGCIFSDCENVAPISTTPLAENATGYTEESIPNFFGSSYSVVKGFTDQLFHCLEKFSLNVRIRMPVSNKDHPRNFISKIIRYEKVVNIPNSITVLQEMIPIMIDMALIKKTGTINLVNPNPISHNEILEMYKLYVDPKFEIHNFDLNEQSQILKAGRSNCTLSAEKLSLLYDVDDSKTAIEKCLKNWKS